MRIAITGANGHVGVNLTKALLAQGHQVRALVHKNARFLQDMPAEKHSGDLLNPDTLRTFLQDIDVVFHLAARISITGDRSGEVWNVNADGTKNLLDAAVKHDIKKFIHFSSIHAFSQSPHDVLLDESRPLVGDGAFAYDRSKAEGERRVMRAAENGLHALVLSPTAILGPADPEPSLTGKAVIALYNKKIPTLVPGGYNWVDVRDVVDGAIKAMEHGRKGEKYLLSGTWCDLPAFSKLIGTISGVKTPQTVVPFWLARVGLPFITLYSRMTATEPLYTSESLVIIREGSKIISSEKAKKELGYQARPLEVTMRDFLQWYRDNGYIK